MPSSSFAGLNSGLRFHQIISDTMSPTIARRDYVLVAFVDRYVGEGYYLISNCFGDAVAYSCSADGTRKKPMIRLHCHNKHYPGQIVSRRYFDEHILAQIVMTCHVVRHDVLEKATRRREVEG